MLEKKPAKKNLSPKALPQAKKLPTKFIPKETDEFELGPLPVLWIYKCNIASPHNGDWTYFFEELGGCSEWGGTWSIDSNASLQFLREEIQVRDLMLAWQSDRQAAVGLCRVTGLPFDGYETSIFLETLMRFARPIKLLKLKKQYDALAKGRGFQPGGGTLFATTSAEAKAIFRLCGVPATLLKA